MNWLKKLVNLFFGKKKIEPPIVKPAPEPQTEVPPKLPAHYIKALNEVGVKEIAGNAHNPRILEYHKATDLKGNTDEIAWCSAFVNWCFKETHQKGTNKANARSWLDWGNVVTEPKKGDVVIFWRGSKTSWQGHVGFFVEETKDSIIVLGGNQGNEVNFSHYKKSQLLGYRRMNA